MQKSPISAAADNGAVHLSASSHPAPGRCLVQLEHVRVTFQGVPALADVSLSVHQGQHLALLGPNAAGKSTLLRVIRGEAYPDQKNGGTVRWFPTAEDVSGDDAPLAGRAMVSLLSPTLQELYMRQAWSIRGEELILAGMYDDYLLYTEPTAAQREQVHALARHLRAEGLLERQVGALSQGQLRLLLLARALVRRPALLLLDEATDGLDAPTRCAFLMNLESLVALPEPPTMVLTTHRSHLPGFLTLAAHMDHGQLTGPTPTARLRQPQAVPIPMLISGPAAPQTLPTQSGIHIILSNATVFIDRTEVLHALDWDIKPGQQWTVLGGNGAGKSTLLRLLIGEEVVAYGGSICRTMDGEEIVELTALQKSVRMVSDRLQALYSYNDTAAEVVFTGIDGSVGVYRDASPGEKAEVDRLLDEAGLTAHAQRPFRSLSTGQARRVLLARALIGQPRLLLLDEPFSGLDHETRNRMIDILESRIRTGLQTILVSHHQEDHLPSATHTAHMQDGRFTNMDTLD